MKSYEIVFQEFQPYIKKSLSIKDSVPEFDEEVLKDLINTSIEQIKNVPTVLNIYGPCVIVGDLHGNIADLISILGRFQDYTTCQFLFLGDYVDRGIHSIEVIVLLLAMLCKFPNNFSLIRGNHEFAHINRLYGFYEEIQIVYGSQDLWLDFQDFFGWLPLAAVVNNSFFCVHGGLSPSLDTIDSINAIQRPIDSYEDNSLISDLVWSDPHDQVDNYADNHRGSGVLFGEVALQTFLTKNNFKVLVRAHQCMADGFSTFAVNTGITVFSSSEYCRLMHNKCGVLKIYLKGRVEMFSFSSDGFDVLEPKNTMVLNKNGIGLKRVFKSQGNILPPVTPTPGYRSPKKVPKKPTFTKPQTNSKLPPQNNVKTVSTTTNTCATNQKLPVLGRAS